MTKTAAAENVVVRAADKEEVEKRRALGRGLESLLPGPRVVGGPGQSGGAVGKQQVPHFVRNEKTEEKASVLTQAASSEPPAVIQAVAEYFLAHHSEEMES